MEVLEMQRAAIERKQARKLVPPRREEYVAAALEGREPPKVNWGGGEFAGPKTLGEWVDDWLCSVGGLSLAHGDPVIRATFTLVDAMRDGPKAAAGAVKPATRGLTRRQQAAVYANLRSREPNHPFAAATPVLAAVRAEWARLKLQEQRPADWEEDR
jgi:hypothetical protein